MRLWAVGRLEGVDGIVFVGFGFDRRGNLRSSSCLAMVIGLAAIFEIADAHAVIDERSRRIRSRFSICGRIDHHTVCFAVPVG